MSRSGISADLEGIDSVGRGSRTNIGFEAVAAHNVDGPVKQAGDIFLYSDVVVDRDVGFGIDLDHDVGVAVGAVIAPRARAEQGGMGHAALAQGAFVFPQPVKDILPVHDLIHIKKAGRTHGPIFDRTSPRNARYWASSLARAALSNIAPPACL